MAKVDFRRVTTNAEVENIDIKDGQFIVTGEGKTFVDYGNERIPICGTPDTQMSDTSTNSVENKIIKEYVDSQIENLQTINTTSISFISTYVKNIENNSYKIGKLVNLNIQIQPQTITMGTSFYKMLTGLPKPLSSFEFFTNEYTSSGNIAQRFYIDENGDIYWWYNNQFENNMGWRILINISYLTND